MPEIGFYHLTRSGPETALASLLGRTLAAGERALVICPDAARLASIDAALWVSQSPDWLPHGTSTTPHPEWQPIFLTENDINPNEASYLFRIAGAAADITPYKRVFDLFDGNDEFSLLAARERWRAAKTDGHALTYWRQTQSGWEKAG
jgi:DNA polymerase-3 subunit chi